MPSNADDDAARTLDSSKLAKELLALSTRATNCRSRLQVISDVVDLLHLASVRAYFYRTGGLPARVVIVPADQSEDTTLASPSPASTFGWIAGVPICDLPILAGLADAPLTTGSKAKACCRDSDAFFNLVSPADASNLTNLLQSVVASAELLHSTTAEDAKNQRYQLQCKLSTALRDLRGFLLKRILAKSCVTYQHLSILSLFPLLLTY